MPSDIHATAVIHPEAELGGDVSVGPNAVIEAGVRVGDRCRIWANAYLASGTTLGADNEVHMGAVLGHWPQDLSFSPETETALEIGEGNVFREYATVHRASVEGAATKIGNRCYLMAHSHVAHDCVLGDEVIICNNALAAGHVEIHDRAFVSGNVVIHQFSRIGKVCMLGGACQVGQDLPPYTTCIGRSEIRGFNVVGMRRAGIDGQARLAIKETYNRIFEARADFGAVLKVLEDAPDLPEIDEMRAFYGADSKRKFVWPP